MWLTTPVVQVLYEAQELLSMRRRTLGDFVNEAACGVQLPQRELVVIAVVQDVEQVRKKGVHVVKLGEVLQDLGQLVVPIGRCELDLWEANTIKLMKPQQSRRGVN